MIEYDWVRVFNRSTPPRPLGGRFALCLSPSRVHPVVDVACDLRKEPSGHATLRMHNPDAWLSARLRQSSSTARIARLVMDYGGNCGINDTHLAAAFSGLARLQRRQERSHQRCYHHPEEKGLLSADPDTISGRGWKELPDDAKKMLLDRLGQRICSLSARHVAIILWSLARLDGLDGMLCPNEGLGREVISASLRSLLQFTPQELSCSIWALARLRWSNVEPGWIEAFQQSCCQKQSSFSRQDFSMVLWSFARLGWRHHIVELRGEGDVSGNSPSPPNSWLGGMLSYQAPTLTLNGLPLNELSTSIWALAQLRIRPAESWSDAFSRGVHRRMCGFTGREIASIMWALPRIYGGRGGMLDEGHAEWVQRMQSLMTQQSGCYPLSPSSDRPPVIITPAMVVSRLAKQVMKRCRQLMMRGSMQPRHVAMCYHASSLMPDGLQSPPGVWSNSVEQVLGLRHVSRSPSDTTINTEEWSDQPLIHSANHEGQLRHLEILPTSGVKAFTLSLDTLTPHTASVLLCALARDRRSDHGSIDRQALWGIASQQFLSPPPTYQQASIGSSRDTLQTAPQAGPMVALLCAAVRLGLRYPPAGFMAALQRATYLARWELKPAEFSSLVEALGKIRARPGRSKWLGELMLVFNRRLEQYTSVQLMKVMWGLSRIGYSPSIEWTDWAVFQLQRKVAAGQNASSLDGAWEAATCISEDEDRAESDRNSMDEIHLQLNSAEVSNSSGSAPDPLLPPVSSHSSQSHLEARQLVFLLQGLSRLDPSSESTMQWMEDLVNNVLAEAAQRGDLSPRDLAYTLWTAGHLSRPTKLRVQRLTHRLDSEPLTEKRSTASLRPLNPPTIQPLLSLSHRSAKVLLQSCRTNFHRFTPGQLSMTAYGALALGVRPDPDWIDALLEASLSLGLSRYTDRDLTLLVNAGGRLKARHATQSQSQRWGLSVMDELKRRAGRLNPEHVLASFLGLSALGELRQSDTGLAAWDRSWLPAFVISVVPSLLAMQPWQLELSYNAAISLEPEMSGVWGSNFTDLLQRSSISKTNS